jgi:hypothetical protein
MLVTIQREKGRHNHGDFVADVAFFSSDSDLTKKDITSIQESKLADVIGKNSFRRFRIRADESKLVMDIILNRNQKRQQFNPGYFVADVAFFSSDSDLTKKDITSIQESKLADVIGKYRIFVDCIKTEEQKELSDRSKNEVKSMNLRSIIQHIPKAMNGSNVKKAIVTNGSYMKNATLSTMKIKSVISELNDLRNRSINRDIYTNIDVGRTLVTTRSTIELDADIVSIIQKEPEVRNSTIRNFILNIHMSNMSLSTFFSLNKVNQIFSNFGMIIGFGRMASTPFSVYNGYAFLLADPFNILSLASPALVSFAVPTGLVILLPRIARFIIKHRIRKKLFFS